MSKWREIQTCNDVVPFQPGKSTKVRKLCINRVHSGPRPSTIVPPRSFVAQGNKYLRLWVHLFTRLIYNHYLSKVPAHTNHHKHIEHFISTCHRYFVFHSREIDIKKMLHSDPTFVLGMLSKLRNNVLKPVEK